MEPTPDVHSFGPTAGRVSGSIGLAVCAGVVALVLFSGPDPVGLRWIAGALLAAVVIWSVMLRPRIVLRAPEIELRNAISSWWVPLAAVEDVTVRSFTRITTATGRYDGAAVGRPLRQLKREDRGRVRPESRADTKPVPVPDSEADVMLLRIGSAVDAARGANPGTAPVRRVWAVPELVALGVTAVLLVGSFLL